MACLDFSFHCKVFAFSLQVGSKPCTCNTHPPTQEAPSAKKGSCDNGATQISDQLLLTGSRPSNLKKDKTSGLPPAKRNLDSVIDPLLLTSSRSSDATRSFLELPTEILGVVFRELLITPRTICRAHKVLGAKQVMESRRPRIKGLEPAILRTCRSIYLHALPILYGDNDFTFDSPQSLTEFAHEGLNGQFAFRNARYGRLTMIRYATIELGHGGTYRYQHPNDLSELWKDTFAPEDCRKTVGFPSLLEIALGFTAWKLGPSDYHEINVSPVLRPSPSQITFCGNGA